MRWLDFSSYNASLLLRLDHGIKKFVFPGEQVSVNLPLKSALQAIGFKADALGHWTAPIDADISRQLFALPGVSAIHVDPDSVTEDFSYETISTNTEGRADQTGPLRPHGAGALEETPSGVLPVSALQSATRGGVDPGGEESHRSDRSRTQTDGDGSERTETDRLGLREPTRRRPQQRALVRRRADSAAVHPASSGNLNHNTNPRHFFLPPAAFEFPAFDPEGQCRANLDALGLLNRLEGEDRPASTTEKEMLARYNEFGGLTDVFKTTSYYDRAWLIQARSDLRQTLDESDLASARAGLESSHTVPPAMAREIWIALREAGFAGGRILNPALGTGVFLGAMPEEIAANSEIIGIERNPLTARMARHLYPDATILTQGFEKAALLKNSIDLVIGAVPFGAAPADFKPIDREYERFGLSLQDYFLVRSLDLVKPGGLVALLTDTSLLDKPFSVTRNLLNERAILAGAVRFPEHTLQGVLGLPKTTDALVFVKRMQPRSALDEDPLWLECEARPEVQDQYVNRYFLDPANRRSVLGRFKVDSGPAQEPSLVVRNEKPLEEVVHGALRRIGVPERILDIREEFARVRQGRLDLPGGKALKTEWGLSVGVGSFLPDPESDGLLVTSEVDADGFIARPYTITGKPRARLRGMAELREAMDRVLNLQIHAPDDQDRHVQARTELNALYDAFVERHGPVNLPVNRRLFLSDPSAGRLFSLEKFNSESQTAEKADIFFRTVITKPVQVDFANSPVEALPLSLARRGYYDAEDVASICRQSVDQINAFLEAEGLIYLDPLTSEYDIAARYLSGDIRTKLSEARMAEELDPGRYSRNIRALEAILPEDIQFGDIDVRLGATWIPDDIVEDFVAEVTGIARHAIKVDYSDLLDEWSISTQGYGVHWEKRNQYGTARRNVLQLLGSALNQQKIIVHDTVHENGAKKQVVNVDETQAANEKLDLIRERFKEFTFENPERMNRLVRIYNDRFNSYVPPSYDGSHLTFPGLSAAIELRPHQKNAVWRAIMEGNALFAHEVGTGKAQPLSAKLLTPTGWVAMGDIKVGDQVIAVDGTPTTVLGVYPQGERPVFRVICDDGAATECCDEHLWFVDGQVMPLSEIRARMTNPQVRPALPLVAPVSLDAQPVPLDPYWLGVLLGGAVHTHRTVQADIFSTDTEVLATTQTLPAVKYRLKGGKYQQATTGREELETILSNLGLLDKPAAIPDIYKFNDIETRTAVLRGILDTAGFVLGKTQLVSIKSDSKRLLEDIAYLVMSLGGVIRQEPSKSCFNKAFVQNERLISILMPEGFVYFSVASKKMARRRAIPPIRHIRAIRPVGIKPVQCIEVAHPARLYVTDDLIVTHNTMCMVATAMEMRRLGKANKPVIAVKNHMLEQIEREARQLYPAANILVINKSELSKEKRLQFLDKIMKNEWDMVIATHSMLPNMKIDNEFIVDYLNKELVAYQEEYEMVRKNREQRARARLVQQKIESLKDRLGRVKMTAQQEHQGLSLAELKIDAIIVDEAQNFKNLEVLQSPTSELSGGISGSDRAFDLYMKILWLYDKRRSISGVIFATGTPVSNHVMEIYNLQRYLQPDVLERAGITKISQWSSTFLYPKKQWEPETSGTGFKLRIRHGLQNVPELITLLRQVMDIVMASDVQQLKRPECRRINITAELSQDQMDILDQLSRRLEKIRNRSVNAHQDNLLKIVTDGRKMSLDPRLLDPSLPDFPGSKVNLMVDKIYQIWQGSREQRSTQMVFCDIGVSSDGGRFSVYEDIREKLVERGMPRSEIVFAQEAESDMEKAEQFAKVRLGDISVYLASTSAAGEGTNVQDRLKALHQLDAPWRASDIEQRRGRMVRHGNENDWTEEYIYTTEGSFDLFMWTVLKTKNETFASILRGDPSIRRFDMDLDPTYAETAAITSSDPRIREKLELDQDISRLKSLFRADMNRKSRLMVQVDGLLSLIEDLRKKLEAAQSLLDDTGQKKPVWEIRMAETGLDLQDYTGDGKAMRDLVAKIMSAQMWEEIPKGIYFNGVPIALKFKQGRDNRPFAIWSVNGEDSLFSYRRISEVEEFVIKIKDKTDFWETQIEQLEAQRNGVMEEINKPFQHAARLIALENRLQELLDEIEQDSRLAA